VTDQIDVIRPGVFVDTNALHYIRSYLDIAKQQHFLPYGDQILWPDINDQLRQIDLTKHQREHLQKGFNALEFLQQKAQEESQIFVSLISLAEIVHGLVEGQAHFNMARAGMPYRMRQRSSDLSELISTWMRIADYEQVCASTEALLPELERLLQIDIWRTGESRSVRDVFFLTEIILSNVYFDVIDAWLYAEALIEQVQQLLTFDGYFRRTINRIYNPAGNVQDDEERAMWIRVQSSLKIATASILMVPPEEENNITIPEAISFEKL
jgi:hypothetical protein